MSCIPRFDRKKNTEYIGIYEVRNISDGSTFYRASKTVNRVKFSFCGKTAKSTALELDKKLIEKGFEPINVLKRKI